MASRLPREDPPLGPRSSYYDYRGAPSPSYRRSSFPRHTPPLAPPGPPPYGPPPRGAEYDAYEGQWTAHRESAAWPDYRPVDVERDFPTSRAAPAARHYYDPWDEYYRGRPRYYPPPPPPADPWYPPEEGYAPDYASSWDPRDVAAPRDAWGPYPPSRPLGEPPVPADEFVPYMPAPRRPPPVNEPIRMGEPSRDRSASFEPSESWKNAHSRSNSLQSPTAANRRFSQEGRTRGRDSISSASSRGRDRAASGSTSRVNGPPTRPSLPIRPGSISKQGDPSSPSRRPSQLSQRNGALPSPAASLPPRPAVKPDAPPPLPAKPTAKVEMVTTQRQELKQPVPAPAPAPIISTKSPGEISEGQAPPIPSLSRSPKPSSIVDDDPDSIQSSRASSRTPAPAVPPKDPTPIPPKASTFAVPPKDATPPPPTRPLSRSSIASSRASVKPSTPQPDAFPGLELDAPSQLGGAFPTPLTSEGALPTPNASEALPTPSTSEAFAADIAITNAGPTTKAVAQVDVVYAETELSSRQDRLDHIPTPRDSAASSRIHTPTPPAIKTDSPADVIIRVQPDEARSKGSPGTLLSTIPPIPSYDDEVGDDVEPSTFDDGLRAFVIDHLLYHDQTRADRIEAVLAGNLAITHPQVASRVPTSPKTLVKEISEPIAQRPDDDGIGTTLENLMENLNTMLTNKQQRLREEYLALNERWKRHCAKLDAQAREMAEPEIAHGRSTRRNAALGDTIRSDLEMEQIIASLSVDEATNPDIVSQRNQATIPDMISVTQGHVPYSYNDNNLRVYDPEEYYAPETGIHDWSPQERDIMLRQYAQTPKQFGYIADKLPNKTAEQCVDFYYLHKKQLLDFRKAVTTYGPKKRGGRRMGKRKGNALLADIAQHDAEVREEVKGPIATRRTRRAQVIATEARRTSARRAASHAETGTSATATPEPEGSGRTTRRRKVPASKGPASAVRSAQPSRQASPEASKAATPVLSNQATPQPEAGPEDAGSTKPDAAPPPSVSVVAQSLLLPMIPAPKPTSPLPSSSSKTIEELDDGAASNRPAKRFKRPGKKYKKSAEIIDDDMEEAAGSKPLPPPSTSSPAATSAPVIMNPAGWTDADTATLLVLLQEHGMNFDRIAAAMPGKTVADVTMVCQNNMVLSSIAQSMGTKSADANAKTDSDAPKSTTTKKVASTTTKTPAPTTNMHPYAMYGGMSMQPPTMPMTAPPNTMQMHPNTMQMQPGPIPMPHIPPYMQSPMYPPPPMHYARYPEYYPRDYWPPPFPGIGGYPGYPPMGPLSQTPAPASGAGASTAAGSSQTPAPGASPAAGSSKAPAGSSQPAAPSQPNGTSDKPSGAASTASKTPPVK